MFSNILLATALSAAFFQADARFSRSHELEEYSFETYLLESGKKFSGEQLNKRKEIFESNIKKIRQHNVNPSSTYKMGVNAFTDRTQEEISSSFGGNKHALGNKQPTRGFKSALSTDSVKRAEMLKSLPASKDWRDDGVVTPVKDQGHCGSCWAHAAVETLESFLAINTGLLEEISIQELVACMPNTDNCGGTGGCEGAIAELAFDYATEFGLTSQAHYGYEHPTYFFDETNSNGACNRELMYGTTEAMPRTVTASGYELLPRNSYEDLMYTIANVGPVSVNVDASTWHLYEDGIFDGCAQDNVDINHVVQLVGYGTCPNSGNDYWLVRNSWTPEFGIGGYIKVARQAGYCGADSHNQDGVGCASDATNVTVCGMCGIMYDSSYPLEARLWGDV